jgi:hypothetical protein
LDACLPATCGHRVSVSATEPERIDASRERSHPHRPQLSLRPAPLQATSHRCISSPASRPTLPHVHHCLLSSAVLRGLKSQEGRATYISVRFCSCVFCLVSAPACRRCVCSPRHTHVLQPASACACCVHAAVCRLATTSSPLSGTRRHCRKLPGRGGGDTRYREVNKACLFSQLPSRLQSLERNKSNQQTELALLKIIKI